MKSLLEGHKLPKALSKQEVYELLDRIKQGDEKAKTKYITSRII